MAPPAPKGRKVDSCVFNGEKFAVDDTITLRPPNSSGPPFVGKISEIVKEPNGEEQCHVSWYYRPEEARGGRKAFHGDKELFTSDHYDWVAKSSINGHCSVHKLREYQQLTEVTDNDYYTRFSYKASKGEFKPDKVPVYCTCEMPYNPDLFMVECESCEEWYHPQCVGTTKKRVEKLAHFECPSCEKKAQAREAKKQRVG
mmetsp:Transcript_5298/g.21660  ORF Transcript_5298/g.21660 Transcript_5298/m.21660 type:complete len:200 (+) Transcript_5298:156-755(+)